MKHVDFPTDMQYVGGDIVPALIADNRKKYSNADSRYNFLHYDIVLQPPYTAFDMVFNRDALQHLPDKDVHTALLQWEKSGTKYLFTTYYPTTGANIDIIPGGYRPINFLIPPFNWEAPIIDFADIPSPEDQNQQDRGDGHYNKRMGIWKLPIRRS
jgi:hypothetical protein